jgi:hypothetical protein
VLELGDAHLAGSVLASARSSCGSEHPTTPKTTRRQSKPTATGVLIARYTVADISMIHQILRDNRRYGWTKRQATLINLAWQLEHTWHPSGRYDGICGYTRRRAYTIRKTLERRYTAIGGF